MTPTIPVVPAMPAVRRHDRHHPLRVVVALLLAVAAWAALPVGVAQAHTIVTRTYENCPNGMGWHYGETFWGHVSGTLREVSLIQGFNQSGASFNYKFTKHDSNNLQDQWIGYSGTGYQGLDPGPVRVGGPYTPRFDYEFDKPGDGQTVWCRLPTHWMPSSQ